MGFSRVSGRGAILVKDMAQPTVPAVSPLDAPPRAVWVRIVNGLGRGLQRLGVRPGPIDPERLMDRARRRARLDDFGDDGFQEPLGILARSLETEAELHPLGRVFAREILTRLLVNRLLCQHLWTRHPEILDVPVSRPLIVAGMPRSGTTLLHRLLALEPSGRPLLFWESLWPAPPPTPETRESDPRLVQARRLVTMLDQVAPEFVAGHEILADGPEECNGLFQQTFEHVIYGFQFRVPSYMEWLEARDMTEPYRYYKKLLQLLGWRYPTERWVLKAPAHTFFLDTLLATLPDARVVLLHRDPLRVIPSLCRLCAGFRRVTSDVLDPFALGTNFVEVIARAFEKALEVLARDTSGRILPVAYDDLLADPVGTVNRINRSFQIPSDAATDERVRGWLAANPQHKRGVHRYRLEQFGLTPEAVNERFAFYREWVGSWSAQGSGKSG
jgi:hypothetical protein